MSNALYAPCPMKQVSKLNIHTGTVSSLVRCLDSQIRICEGIVFDQVS